MPSIVLRLFLVLLQSCCTHGLQLGRIGNVSLVGSQVVRVNQTSCSQCACLLSANATLVAFNCYLSNQTCDIITSYNTTITYTIQTNPNSTFYFRQLPPISLLTTENPEADTTRSQTTTTTTMITTTTSRTTTTTSTVSTSTTTSAGTTTTTTADPCPSTAAGSCTCTAGSSNSSLHNPIDLYMNRNGTILYVAEYTNNRVQAFQVPSKYGTTVPASAIGLLGVYFDDNLSRLYTSEYGTPGRLSLWPSGQTLPPTGTMSCALAGGWASMPYGIVGDQNGNIYVSHNTCNTLIAWPRNSSVPRCLAGTCISATQLSSPRHIYLDEDNGFIYVADTNNHRIQRFSVNGTGAAVTVAGGNGPGTGLNQLNAPTGVYVSKKNGSIYISERDNHRVTKWLANAVSGTVVAGSASGASGTSSSLLNQPFAVILDRNETWMYVADYNNNRVQRFPVV